MTTVRIPGQALDMTKDWSYVEDGRRYLTTYDIKEGVKVTWKGETYDLKFRDDPPARTDAWNAYIDGPEGRVFLLPAHCSENPAGPLYFHDWFLIEGEPA